MKKVLKNAFEAGAKRTSALRLVGDVVGDMLRSNSPFAQAFRKHQATLNSGKEVACV